MHPLVETVKKSVESYVARGEIIGLPHPLPDSLSGRAGVFVCIKKRGELRGCIGTFQPACDCIGSEAIANAVSAATKDPRFPPVTEDELPELTYSVDVLSCPEKVSGPDELDPKKYGVIVVSGLRRGLLLPDLEGVDTVQEQLRIAMMKAGIFPQEEYEICRFEVIRYT